MSELEENEEEEFEENEEEVNLEEIPFANLDEIFPSYDEHQSIFFLYKGKKIEVVVRKGLSGSATDEISQAVTSYTKDGQVKINQKKYKRMLWSKLVIKTNPNIPLKKLIHVDSILYNEMLERITAYYQTISNVKEIEEKMIKN